MRKLKQNFGLRLVEGGHFLPKIEPIAPSPILADLLADAIPGAIAVGSRKSGRTCNYETNTKSGERKPVPNLCVGCVATNNS
ncbi:MAG: hypothetical protein ACRC62_33355 [Microcoleus sp.]